MSKPPRRHTDAKRSVHGASKSGKRAAVKAGGRAGSKTKTRGPSARATKRHPGRRTRTAFTCHAIPRTATIAFDAQPGGWERLDLTFSVGTPPPGISEAAFSTIVRRALQIWREAVPFVFTEDVGGGTLSVTSVPLQHGDGFDFTATSPELGHGFGPATGGGTLDGQVHLNDTKTWADGTGADADVLTVVLHELGHALGIVNHLDGTQTVMNGSFAPGLVRRELAPADIAAIQALYAAVMT